MNGILDRLAKGPLLFDGAMGSLLLAAGLEVGTAPEAWNLDHPEILRKIHQDYLASGAEVLTTNSFGGSPLKLTAHGLAERCEKVNFAAVSLAMGAALEQPQRRIFVAGDIGPCGQFFPPVGELDEPALVESLKEQIGIFNAAGVDFFLIETMVDFREAEISVRTARAFSDLPVIATMTFDKKKRGYFTIMGDKPGDCARRLADAGADVIGANCTLTAPEMVELAEILVDESPAPVLIQPNAGQPEIVDGQAVYRVTPGKFAADVGKILATGVAAVGGCCGTTPEHIRAVAELMRHEYNSSQD